MKAAVETRVAEYWAAHRSTDHQLLHERATALVHSTEPPDSGAYHSALFVLLHHGEVTEARDAIERALAADYDGCVASLLPVLAHAYQRLGDMTTAHELFEQCAQRGLLFGRNAFLARTADAVAFSAAYESGDEDTVLARARRFVESGEDPSSDLYHAAICALLARNDVATAKEAIEKALASHGDACAPNLLPLLAHAHQRLHDILVAHRFFQQCLERGYLTGRNAFLASTVEAVAFTAAYETDAAADVVPRALRFVEACDTPSTEVYHAALLSLLARGHVDVVKNAVEKAMAQDFDKCSTLLLPILAHVYQRLEDVDTAHALYESCQRLDLLVGRNAFLASSATDVAHAFAELAMYRARAAEERDADTTACRAGTLVARALYEGAFAAARMRAASSAPTVLTQPAVAPRTPDFMIAGSAKCGTTYLYDFLSRSPSIWKRAPKELHYFTSMYRFGDAFYSKFFELCPDGLLCGESSPDYLDDCCEHRPVDERIQACCPDVRIMVVLRDPALRAVSWYNQMTTNDVGRGGRPGSRRLTGLTIEQLRAYRNGNALTQGRFIDPLRRFVRTFGRERLLILTIAELGDVESVSDKVSSFLGIEPPVVGSVPPRQNSGGHDKPSDALYGELREYYRESLETLEQEFGIRL